MQANIALHPAALEDKLRATGSETVEYAKSLAIVNDDAFQTAGEFLREIKARTKQVTDYWADPKAKAAAAHKEIVAKEKAMTAPLTEAEAIIKRSMTVYQQEQLAKRRAEEAEIRRKQQEERDRLLAEAAAAETAGNVVEAEVTLAMAEMVEDMAPAPVAPPPPKAQGISTRTTWKARIVNEKIVPPYANGVTIRPVDLSALNGIARLTKGTATIPGIEFYEDASIAVR